MKKILPGNPVAWVAFASALVVLLVATACHRNLTQGSTGDRRAFHEQLEPKIVLPGETGKSLNTGKTKPEDIIRTARGYLGVPHCMGGKDRGCMDCSGLLVRVFASHGIDLPHNSEEQARYGRVIREKQQLEKGDMVFFVRTYKTNRTITHSGIYLGDGQFIHTSSSSGVSITPLDSPYWNERFAFGTRLFE